MAKTAVKKKAARKVQQFAQSVMDAIPDHGDPSSDQLATGD